MVWPMNKILLSKVAKIMSVCPLAMNCEASIFMRGAATILILFVW